MPTLQDINAQLNAIPDADVRRPDRPVATFVQQNNDLVTYLQGDVLTKLGEVGFTAERLEQYKAAVGTLQAAESSWQAARKTRTAEELVALELDADSLRRDLVAALRWNLRDDRNAQAVLTEVQLGEGHADLAMDLETLASLIANNEAAFALDTTFDTSVNVESARMKANEVRQAFSDEKASDSAADLMEMRNRAFTWLDTFWDDARRAGRYVFRKDATELAHFRDDFSATQRRRSRTVVPALVTD